MTNIELMNYWIESSDADYNTMLYMKDGNKNTWALFIGHLVIEKLLKGLYARENSENPVAPKVHNLILLCEKSNLEVPQNIREKIQVINTFNIGARYDDYKNSFEQKCTDDYTELQVRSIEEVRRWLKEQLIQK